jgi:hypothetical protein
MTRVTVHILFAVVTLIAAGSSYRATLRVSLEVDARDVTRGIQHVHLTFPVHAGPLTFAYPKWIPGEHKPSGPITQLMNVHVAGRSSGGATRWTLFHSMSVSHHT